ncbi:MAG: hypothetical protein PW734_03930 [Verrucomicrobium sp.]|nr:hypothetical protein [Verrucomicrobium sp.]
MSWFRKEPLSLTPEAGKMLENAFNKGELARFARRYALTSRHFLIPDDSEDRKGWTPLHEAGLTGHLDQVAAALPKGDHFTIADFLTPSGDGWTPLHAVSGRSDLLRVAAMLGPQRQGLSQAELNVTDTSGYTPLHTAAAQGYFDTYAAVLRLAGEGLTAAPFLVKERNANVWSPLRFAETNGHLKKLFVPELWAGRVGEMAGLWRHVSPEGREKVDIGPIFDEAVRLSPRRIEPGVFRAARRAAAPFPAREERGRDRE